MSGLPENRATIKYRQILLAFIFEINVLQQSESTSNNIDILRSMLCYVNKIQFTILSKLERYLGVFKIYIICLLIKCTDSIFYEG